MGKNYSEELNIEVENKNDAPLFIIRVKGVLDAVTSPELEREVFATLSETKNRLLINLEGVDYISSAGLRTLLTASRKIETYGGKFLLCSASENVLITLKNSGFGRFFKWKHTEKQALDLLLEP